MHGRHRRVRPGLACMVLAWSWIGPAGAVAPPTRADTPPAPTAPIPSVPRSSRDAALAALFDPLPHSETQVSACVMALPGGQIHLDVHADRVLIPASTHKVVTSAVALDVLGAEYGFSTALYRAGEDLVIIGGGDPGFGDEQLCTAAGRARLATLEVWADALKVQDISRVRDIVLDDSCFESVRVHPAWEPEDLPKWYAAPVGGVNFNDNCIDVTVVPRGRGRPDFSVFPPTDWIRIDNNLRHGSGTPWLHRPSAEPVYELRGSCDQRQTIQAASVPDPALLFGHALKTVLAARGIIVDGAVRRHSPTDAPAAARVPVATHTTPITDVLTRTLHNSQNLFAECLLKAAVRADRPGQAGSWAGGTRLVANRLRRWGVPLDGAVFSDGSGLSRANRLSARQLVEVLKHVYLDRALGDVFISYMASDRDPPTVRRRFRNIPGNVFLKTGYMTGIKSLCGYVLAEDGQWWAFAVIFNDIPGENAPYNTLFVDLCNTLAQQAATR